MSVLHINIPSFPIEVERLKDPRLRRRPVAIAASRSPRAPLLYVSPEAHASGIQKGVSQKRARSLERSLICLTPSYPLYERAQKKLLEVIARFTPVLEPMRLGSIFLDMTGMELLFGRPAAAASKIRRELMRTFSLDPTLGVARNKLVSRVAAKVMRPHGLYQVYPGHETEFLHPLEVEYLPGVGRVTSGKLLRELGIRRIGELADIPVNLLAQLFGKQGVELHHKACGEDTSVVADYLRDAPRRIQESAIFSEPTNNDRQLLAELWRLCERVGVALRAGREVTAQGMLEGIYLDGLRIRQRVSYDPPTQSDFILFKPWERRWQKFMERRTRLKSLTLILQDLGPEFEQLDFMGDRREQRILTTLDGLRERYGDAAVRFGRAHVR